MKKKVISGLALMLSALMLASCASEGAGTGSDQKMPVGQSSSAPAESGGRESSGAESAKTVVFPDFSATDLDGNEADQTLFADADLTMVNIWATFCSPCLREMPELGEISEEYKEKNVRIVGIVSDVLDRNGKLSQEQVDLSKEIVEKTGAGYQHLLPSLEMYATVLSGINSVPTTFFVNQEGVVVGAYLGAKSKDDWKEIIDSLLEAAT